MHGRSRFIKGNFRGSEANGREADDGRATANNVSETEGNLKSDTSPTQQERKRTTKLSSTSRELLSGREVAVNDIQDDVSSINDSIYMQAFGTGKSMLVAEASPFTDDGSSPDKPINLSDLHADDADSLESGRSLSTTELKKKLNEFASTYEMVDLDHTDVLSGSSHGSSNKKSNWKKNIHLQRAPRWLKFAILGSILAIILAVVVAVLGVRNGTSSDTSPTNPINELSTSSEGQSDTEAQPTIQSVFTPSEPAQVEPVSEPAPAAPALEPSPVPVPVFVLTNPPVSPPTAESYVHWLTATPTSVRTLDIEENTEVTETPVEETTTAFPTQAPTVEPTTAAPTTPLPTSRPTTAFPTSSPTINIRTRAVIYFTAGHVEDSLAGATPNTLRGFPTRKGTSFLVHLGNWNNCKDEDFQEAADTFANSSVPVYFVLGDCKNGKKSKKLYDEYLLDFETKHWAEPPWEVFRQGDTNEAYKDFSENFLFTYAGGVFMSINPLMSGDEQKAEEEILRMEANLEWIDFAYNFYRKESKSIFLFTHEAPNQANQLFFLELYNKLENDWRNMEFILVHHTDSGGGAIEKKYNGIKNLSVLAIQGTLWPPLQMTIDFEKGKPRIELDQDWEAELED